MTDGTPLTAEERMRVRELLDKKDEIDAIIERDKRLGWLGKGFKTILLYVAGSIVAISTIWTALRGAIRSIAGGP